MLHAEISTACLRVFEHDSRCVRLNTKARLAISRLIIIISRRGIIYIGKGSWEFDQKKEESNILIFGKPLVGKPMAAEHMNALAMTSRFG